MSKSYNSVFHERVEYSESRHFWFRARKEMIQKLMTRCVPHPEGKTFLEVGCGTGMLLQLLESLGFTATGIDINVKALCYAKKKTNATLLRKSFFSFRTTKTYDCIGLFDVLEHQRDDRKFLLLCHKILKQNGTLFLTVPAGMYLWNTIDEVSGHVRRYGKKELVQKLQKAGFRIVYLNYWNVFLLPWYILWRSFYVLLHKQTALYHYADNPSPVVNRFGAWALRMEQQYMFDFAFPFGTSLVVVAKKGIIEG